MPRKTKSAPESKAQDVGTVMPPECTEEQQIVEQRAQQLQVIDARLGLEIPYDFETYVSVARAEVSAMGQHLFRIGQICLAIREHSPGRFEEALERISIAPRFARKCMATVNRFLATPERKRIADSLPAGKLLELLSEDDDDIDALADGGTIADLTLDEMAGMTQRELRDALRKAREERKRDAEAHEQMLQKKDKALNDLHKRLTRLEDAPLREQVEPMLQEIGVRCIGSIMELTKLRDGIKELLNTYNDNNEQVPKDIDSLLEDHARTVHEMACDIGELAHI